MSAARGVVFDNDGLLLDTEEAWTRAEETLFARHGHTFTIEHKRYLIGSSRATAALKLEEMLFSPGDGESLMDELHELVMSEVLQGVTPRPGALDLLSRLKQAGTPLALASNSQREFLTRALSSAGLPEETFQITISAEDVEHPKPAPDIYLRACAELNLEPSHCAALEDSATGVAAAAAAGLFVIGVPYFQGTKLPGSDLIADSLADPAVARALGLGS
jgi:HAD superfamily hydrolase (TIGR01509 family)